MQTDVYNLRVETDVSGIIKAQAARCGISANAFAIAILRAAAQAIENETGPVIPPRFEFTPQSTALNEGKSSYKKK